VDDRAGARDGLKPAISPTLGSRGIHAELTAGESLKATICELNIIIAISRTDCDSQHRFSTL
jgi:hypothetical protein